MGVDAKHRRGLRIRCVLSTLGEHPMPGGNFPKEGLEEHYEKVEP
jgi:hypothetical protein